MYAIPSHPLQSNCGHTFPSEQPPEVTPIQIWSGVPAKEIRFQRLLHDHRSSLDSSALVLLPVKYPCALLPGLFKVVPNGRSGDYMISCTCSCRKAATGDTQTRGGWLFAHATAAAAAAQQLPYLLSLVLLLVPIFNSAVLW